MYFLQKIMMVLLLKMEEQLNENIIKKDDVLCVVARAGSPDCVLLANSIDVLFKSTSFDV